MERSNFISIYSKNKISQIANFLLLFHFYNHNFQLFRLFILRLLQYTVYIGCRHHHNNCNFFFKASDYFHTKIIIILVVFFGHYNCYYYCVMWPFVDSSVSLDYLLPQVKYFNLFIIYFVPPATMAYVVTLLRFWCLISFWFYWKMNVDRLKMFHSYNTRIIWACKEKKH